REPRQLNRLPDRDSGEDGESAGDRQREVRSLLQRVVLALMWMVFAPERVELDHLPAVADVAFTRHEIAPLAVEVHEREVDQTVHDEHPHHGEMPMPRAAQP